MGHEKMYLTYSDKNSCKDIYDLAINYVKTHGDRYGTEVVRFPTEVVFETYNDAYNYINTNDRGWYDGIAVQYRDYSNVKNTAKADEIQKKIDETRRKLMEYVRQHSVKKQKAAYIGCSSCGSKLNREKLHGDYCPLCNTDLRSETTLNRIAAYKKRIKEYEKALVKEKIKSKEKAQIMWLVKFEYHC